MQGFLIPLFEGILTYLETPKALEIRGYIESCRVPHLFHGICRFKLRGVEGVGALAPLASEATSTRHWQRQSKAISSDSNTEDHVSVADIDTDVDITQFLPRTYRPA